MQCPETPQISTKHALASSLCNTSIVCLPDGAINPHHVLPKFSYTSSPTSCTDSPPKLSVDAEAASDCAEICIKRATTPTKNFSKPFRKSQNDDDVFKSQSVSSVAALRFHVAARRLALSPLSETLQNQSMAAIGHNKQKHQHDDSPYGKDHFQRKRTPCHIQQPNRQSYAERDITSARKYSPRKRMSPGRTPVHCVPVSGTSSYGSPIPFKPREGQGSRSRAPRDVRNFSRPTSIPYSSPARTRTRNFSRPVRPYQTSGLSTLKQCTPTKFVGNVDASVSFGCLEDVDRIDHAPDLSRKADDPIVFNQAVTHAQDQPGDLDQSGNSVESDPIPPREAHPVQASVRESFESAVSECIGEKRLQLSTWEIWLQRILFSLFIFLANIALGLAYLGSFKHPYMLPVLVFMKSKDVLSTAANYVELLHNLFRNLIWPPKKPDPRWILSLVCAYAETEEQILKTVFSLARGSTQPHKQVICIILDGKPRDILSKMSTINVSVKRSYTTWRGNRGEITVNAGHLEGIPLLLVVKAKNAGKKDSLILGHDLFNYPRKDMPHSTRLLRQEIWQSILPALSPKGRHGLGTFDFIFCTDADSTIHEQALRRLADALCRENDAIAACGVLFAEFGDKKTEYAPWHLFQQFQYTYGQYVRRQAESVWGRVTCLPGCITMIAVRRELGAAVSEYARPVTEHNLFRHQVQYLGTDRRFTWCMMTQGKHLRTIFVPDALSETVVPSGVSHYLSQRRRWASNAYFNDFFYLFGPRQRLVTRIFAAVDIVRLSLVYYRVFNTGYFLHGLITHFYLVKIIPTLVVTKTPATWYLMTALLREPFLRKRLHKILLGMCINQIISPILSVIVFTNVLFHMGSQAWGKTGASTQGPAPGTVTTLHMHIDTPPTQHWTPRRLASTVRTAIRGVTPKQLGRSAVTTTIPSAQGDLQNDNHTGPRTARQSTPQRDHPPALDGANIIQPTDSGISETPIELVDTISNVYTPIKPYQNPRSTPLTLTKRTPFHRKHTQSKLKQVDKAPVRVIDDATSALVCDD